MRLRVDDVLAEYFTISHRRNLAADDVTIHPEISPDLVNWRSGDGEFVFVSELHQGDGTSVVTYRTVAPRDPEVDLRAFMRLKIAN
tara:strand:- start:859 stop:1116 length:258 start_codon:yes stop_codon:yes gene_type:complete